MAVIPKPDPDWDGAFAERKEREGDQRLPTPSEHPDIIDEVINDLKERKRIGVRRYGTPLKAFNGRSALRDAYEESLDRTNYLRQVLYEEDYHLNLLKKIVLSWATNSEEGFHDAMHEALKHLGYTAKETVDEQA